MLHFLNLSHCFDCKTYVQDYSAGSAAIGHGLLLIIQQCASVLPQIPTASVGVSVAYAI